MAYGEEADGVSCGRSTVVFLAYSLHKSGDPLVRNWFDKNQNPNDFHLSFQRHVRVSPRGSVSPKSAIECFRLDQYTSIYARVHVESNQKTSRVQPIQATTKPNPSVGF